MTTFLVTVGVLGVAFCPMVASATGMSVSQSITSAYEAFRIRHNRTESLDSASYRRKLALFARRYAQVEAHNARPGESWRAELNKFADHADDEFQSMLGYRRAGPRPPSPSSANALRGSSFLQLESGRLIAQSRDWRGKLSSSKMLREQGHCGSCWAVAAVGALEMHMELATGKAPPKLSFKQLVDCVPNPHHCGGDGGCKGARAEDGFLWAEDVGVTLESAYRDSDEQDTCNSVQKPFVRTRGFVGLPTNKLHPLLDAVYNKGPVVVSVDASDWSTYASGVFDGCGIDATVNHAVLMVGFGHDVSAQKKYWTIRNSWGPDWGEDGFLRLQRHDTDRGDEGYCGTDYNPKAGVGCDGGPPTVVVCGMCGILFDSVYPEL